MTPTEFTAALDQLGLRGYALARLVGAHPNTISRYATGQREIPGALALLLRAWVARPKLLAEVQKGAPVERSTPS